MNVGQSQLILMAVLIVAAVAGLAGMIWALREGRPVGKQPAGPRVYKVHVEGAKVFGEIDMSQVEQYARAQMQQSALKAAEQLQSALTQTVAQITSRLSDFAGGDLSQEFEKYRVSLEALRAESIHEFSKLEKELGDKRTERLEQLDKELTAEYQRRLAQFDSRLSDVVSGYLLEALGEKVDLGAQAAYIFGVLEQHKDDIKRDVLQ